MVEALLIFIAVVVTAVVVVQVILLLRKPGLEIQARLQGVEESLGNTERAMRDEFARSREEAGRQAKGLRDEVGTTLKQDAKRPARGAHGQVGEDGRRDRSSLRGAA